MHNNDRTALHGGRRRRGGGPAARSPFGEGFTDGFPGGRGRGKFGFGGGGHGGRRGKRFAGEELRLMVLGLLAEEAPQHGYQLIRAFAAKSGDAYSPSPGVLYPLLSVLADMGLVDEVAEEGSARRRFSLTAAGQSEATAKKDEVETLFQRLATMAETAGRADAAPVRRAMMNLRTAAIQRLTRDATDPETAFAIAAILDEAAQKIERL